MVRFFVFLKLLLVCSVVTISDLVHNVDGIYDLHFHRHHSYFRKDFKMLLAVNIGHI